MWLLFSFLLIAGAALAEHDHAWETGKEYQYAVHSVTLADLEELTKESTGVVMKAVLTIQATSPDTLQAVVTEPQYARIHNQIPEESLWFEKEKLLEFHKLHVSEKPFKVKIKHGIIRDLQFEKDVSIVEMNLAKSVMSQLQVDTQGENKVKSKHTQVPDNEYPFAVFKAMEDSVGGKCEVLYDIMPLSESILYDVPQLVPLPELDGNGQYIDIMKTKNYTRCEHEVAYHFGIGNHNEWSPINQNGYVSRVSTSRIVISGNLKRFTIQSSVTKDKININQKMYTGYVRAKVNLTLSKVDKFSTPLPISEDLVSTGNLVYMLNSPFSTLHKHNKAPSIGRESMPDMSSESSESSSEERHKNRDSQDSESFSASSESIGNSHERNYLHSKPSLDQVPDIPLLPYFIGYKGKAIQYAEQMDTVAAAAQLIKELPEIIEYTRVKSLNFGLLEKFTILTRLVRTMDTKQIDQLQAKVAELASHVPKDTKDEIIKYYHQYYWDILRDALAHAGTGPAFITLRDWIKEGKLNDWEAARIVSKLPKTARMPTTEYIQAFFEMITQPNIKHKRFLNTTAPSAFAELVRYVHVNPQTHYNRYPLYAFGRMVPKHDQTVVETYIPYMAQQLKEAIKEGHNPRIQTYIWALGSFGHPKILAVFEPYLEGTVPVSSLQRFMMILSLRKLAEIHPRLVRNVAYKIYANVQETDDVRCLAVFIIMKTNPALFMLQRMAEFTNRDESKQVNSAVRSYIETIAELKTSEMQNFAAKARIAKKLLKPHHKSYDKKYSQVWLKHFTWDNAVYKLFAYIIGSNDSNEHKSEMISMIVSHGAFDLPTVQAGYIVSSMKQLKNLWNTMNEDEKNDKPSAVEKIVRALNIQPEDPQHLEGNSFFDGLFAAGFFPFDKSSFERFIDRFMKTFVKAMEPGLMEFNNANYLMSHDITIAFPIESGLPFIYSMEISRLVRISGEGKFNIKPMQGFTTNLNIAGHLVAAESLQNRVGFVTPFDHHQYIAGVDDNTQLFLPIGFELKYQPLQNNLHLKIHPDNYYRYGLEMITLASSTVPYTSTYDILKLQPVLLDKGTRNAYIREPHVVQLNLNNLDIAVSSDLIKKDEWMGDYRSKYEVLSKLLNDNPNYKLMAVILKSLPGEVNITFNTVETDANNAGDETLHVSLPAIVDKQPNSEARRQQFLEEVSKDINSATNYIFDVNAYLPTITTERQIITLAFSESNVDNKYRAFLYWKTNNQDDKVREVEICAAGLMRLSQNIFLNPEKAINRVLEDELDIKLQIGHTCEDGLNIRIGGNQTRNDDLTKAILQSNIFHKCEHEVMQGNKGLHACQEVITLANTRNHAHFSIDIDSVFINEVVHKLIEFTSQNVLSMENVNYVMNTKNSEKNTIDLAIKMSPDFKTADIKLHTSKINMEFNDIDLSETGLSSFEKKVEYWFDDNDDFEVSCTVDKNKAITFDNKTYPVTLGKCWHVMMTSYPQKNPDNPQEMLSIPENIQVAVLVKETDDGHKQVRIIIGDKEFEMYRASDHLEVTLNGQKLEFSQHKSHREKKDDETIIEIFALPDESVRLLSEEYEIDVVFDGERIRLEVSNEYHSEIRGLCGNYDGQSNNDFTTPKNCVLKKPEEFAATYALMDETCEGHAKENKQKAEQSKCAYVRHHQTNVISDREAGRPSIENKKWGYHYDDNKAHNAQGKRCTNYHTNIVEEDESLCFTTRPLPTCAEGCKSVEIKTKKYPLHCMPKGEASQQLKRRIEAGANPNMILRSVSKLHSYEVPVKCVAV